MEGIVNLTRNMQELSLEIPELEGDKSSLAVEEIEKLAVRPKSLDPGTRRKASIC